MPEFQCPGREMFGGFRLGASSAETGASNLFLVD
jgi:phosphogluconate dehydratase